MDVRLTDIDSGVTKSITITITILECLSSEGLRAVAATDDVFLIGTTTTAGPNGGDNLDLLCNAKPLHSIYLTTGRAVDYLNYIAKVGGAQAATDLNGNSQWTYQLDSDSGDYYLCKMDINGCSPHLSNLFTRYSCRGTVRVISQSSNT